jgi:two-component system sensor histidine kinase HydH
MNSMSRRSIFTSGATGRFSKFASPWAVLGAAAILAGIVTAFAIFNVDREKEAVSRILREKGAALIKAVEAGTRTGMMGGLGAGTRIQGLLQETTKQQDILFIIVTDRDGRLLAGSSNGNTGVEMEALNFAVRLAADKEERWTTYDKDERQQAFVVYRHFLYEMGEKGVTQKGDEESLHTFLCPGGCVFHIGRDIGGLPLAIYVGMDASPVEQAVQRDLGNFFLMAAVVLVLGFSGMVAVFWANNARMTRKLLLDSKAFSSAVVANLPVGLVLTDAESRISYVNEGALPLLQCAADAAVGKAAEAVLPALLLEKLYSAEPGRPVFEWESKVRIGEDEFPLSVSASAVSDEMGNHLGRVLILRDLREMKHLEGMLRKKEKSAALGEMAAQVAHEIRNPLGSIKGFASHLAGKLEPESSEGKAADIMVREAERLNRVITELLEVAGPSRLKLEHKNPMEVVEHTLDLIAQDAEMQGVELRLEKGKDIPLMDIDPDKLSQALLNLYLNALQAMQNDGGGALTVRVEANGKGRLHLSVCDTGIGIAPEKLSHIFDPYFTDKAEGSGLGLAVVRKVVEAHGGEIFVDSTPGKGSTFNVHLPVLKSEGAVS